MNEHETKTTTKSVLGKKTTLNQKALS